MVKAEQDAELTVEAVAPWRATVHEWCGPILIPGSHLHHFDPKGMLVEIIAGEVGRCLEKPTKMAT